MRSDESENDAIMRYDASMGRRAIFCELHYPPTVGLAMAWRMRPGVRNSLGVSGRRSMEKKGAQRC